MNSSSFRFLPWISFFFLALCSIPIFIGYGMILMAKAVGISVTVILVVVIRIWLIQLKKTASPEPINLNANDLHDLKQFIPNAVRLHVSDQFAIQNRLGLLMRKIRIENPDSVNLEELQPRSLALLCAGFILCHNQVQNEQILIILKERGALKQTQTGFEIGINELKETLEKTSTEQIQKALIL